MDYAELKQIFWELKRTSPREDLTAHIIFTEDSFDKPYSLLSRTYCISSNLKPFAGDQTACGEWVELRIDQVYGYRTLLERYLNKEVGL